MGIHKDLMPLALQLRNTQVEVEKLRRRTLPEPWSEFLTHCSDELHAMLNVVAIATPSVAEMKIEGYEYLRWPEP